MSSNRGKITISNQAKVKQHELITAQALIRTGDNVEFLPPLGLDNKTPDIYFRGCYWEIKSPVGRGRRTIENILRKATKQSPNIILDSRRTNMSVQSIRQVINWQLKKAHAFKKIIVIDKNGQLLFCYGMI